MSTWKSGVSLTNSRRCFGSLGVDEDDIDIRRAAEQGIDLLRDERAGQVRGDDVAVVEGALLRGLFGDSDQ